MVSELGPVSGPPNLCLFDRYTRDVIVSLHEFTPLLVNFLLPSIPLNPIPSSCLGGVLNSRRVVSYSGDFC